jgi:hypothetical protein
MDDLEADETRMGYGLLLYRADARSRRSDASPVDDSPDGILLSLKDSFYGAIATIADPAVDVSLLRRFHKGSAI